MANLYYCLRGACRASVPLAVAAGMPAPQGRYPLKLRAGFFF